MMNRNPHFFLGLADAPTVLISRRKSFLMDASNFLVGTSFSIRFLAFSIALSESDDLKLQAECEGTIFVTLKKIEEDSQIVCFLASVNKPNATAIPALRRNNRRLFQWANYFGMALLAFVFNCRNVFWFNRAPSLDSHTLSKVTL